MGGKCVVFQGIFRVSTFFPRAVSSHESVLSNCSEDGRSCLGHTCKGWSGQGANLGSFLVAGLRNGGGLNGRGGGEKQMNLRGSGATCQQDMVMDKM